MIDQMITSEDDFEDKSTEVWERVPEDFLNQCPPGAQQDWNG
jgi:hypothetical protein